MSNTRLRFGFRKESKCLCIGLQTFGTLSAWRWLFIHKPKHVAVKLHDIHELLWLKDTIFTFVCLYRNRMFHLKTTIFALKTDCHYCSEDSHRRWPVVSRSCSLAGNLSYQPTNETHFYVRGWVRNYGKIYLMLVCWLYCILCILVLVARWVYLYAAERPWHCGVLKQSVPDTLRLSHV